MPDPTPLRFAVAVIACAATLFVWSGLTQVFPWGVPTVQVVAQTTGEPAAFGASPVRRPPGALATSAFDDELGDGNGTLTTDRSFAWIVSVPVERYHPTRYFIGEAVTQLACAAMLVEALWLLSSLPLPRRALVLALLATAAAGATYGYMTNWWGLPLRYSGGMSVNLVVGWVLGAAVASVVLDRRRDLTAPA
ncbi:MAG: hypothetical protein INH41_28445 [Myxococcaceae bacterium]|jgi:hypothetical protein|nr:hypothetical protein [Myxococcaceae bacterium]MCA3016331.1 hypothetical protein [Myxococcaceae bacterium]